MPRPIVLNHPLEGGIVTNWDDMEQIWRHGIEDVLRVEAMEHPILMADSTATPPGTRWDSKTLSHGVILKYRLLFFSWDVFFRLVSNSCLQQLADHRDHLYTARLTTRARLANVALIYLVIGCWCWSGLFVLKRCTPVFIVVQVAIVFGDESKGATSVVDGRYSFLHPTTHPLLSVVRIPLPPLLFVARFFREKATEVLFESLASPAMHMALQPVLALYACGPSSGLVVDIGDSGTQVNLAYDG